MYLNTSPFEPLVLLGLFSHCEELFQLQLLYMWLVYYNTVLPVVEVNPSTQIHSAGDTTTVNCHASGRPQPHISWQLNEQALQSSDSHYLLTGKCPHSSK